MIIGCDILADSFCSNCRFNKVFCCGHRVEHLKNHPDHEVVVFLSDFNDEAVKLWTSKIFVSLGKLEESRKKYLNVVSKIFKEIHNECQKIELFFWNTEKNLLCLLKTLRQLKGKILTSDLKVLQRSSEVEFSEMKSNGNFSFLSEFSTQIKISAVQLYEEVFRSYQLSDGLEMMQEFSSFYSLTRNPQLEIPVEEPDPEIFIFYVDGQHVRKFDTQTLTSSVVIFNDKVTAKLGASAVKFEGNIWFYSYQKDFYLLDFDKSISQKFKENAIRTYYLRGMVYHNSNLYLFGGVGGSHGQILVKEAEVYSKSIWKSIAPPPNVLKSTSAKVLDDKIYLVGYNQNSLLIYEDYKNGYKDIIKLSDSPVCKVLCGKFILVNRSNTVWIIENDGIRQVAVNQDIICDSLAINTVFENHKFCYFLVWEGNLMRFNKETLKSEVISIGLVRD